MMMESVIYHRLQQMNKVQLSQLFMVTIQLHGLLYILTDQLETLLNVFYLTRTHYIINMLIIHATQ